MSDTDTAIDPFLSGDVPVPDTPVIDATVALDQPTPSDRGGDSGSGFDWYGLDTFINSLDQQAAAWYVLTRQQAPTARTVPPVLGGPPLRPVGSFGASLPASVASIPPIVWIGALVVLVLVLRK
jgi:hypothetical protein